MKRGTFKALQRHELVEVTGYTDRLMGIYQLNGLWYPVHLATGRSIGYFDKLAQAKAFVTALEMACDPGQPTAELMAASASMSLIDFANYCYKLIGENT